MERYSDVAVEVMHTYVNTMRWYFFNHFEKYNRELQKLQVKLLKRWHILFWIYKIFIIFLKNPVADKYDMMGYDESVRKGILEKKNLIVQLFLMTPHINIFESLGGLWGTGKIALQDKANIYVLQDRIKTLRNQDAGVILVHVAENKSKVRVYSAI
jgi:hypothetical protein